MNIDKPEIIKCANRVNGCEWQVVSTIYTGIHDTFSALEWQPVTPYLLRLYTNAENLWEEKGTWRFESPETRKIVADILPKDHILICEFAPEPITSLSNISLHPWVMEAIDGFWDNPKTRLSGVEEAYKLIVKKTQEKVDFHMDGQRLFEYCFSSKDKNSRLRFRSKSGQLEIDSGIRDFALAVVDRCRNILAHTYHSDINQNSLNSYRYLVAVNRLAELVDRAEIQYYPPER